MGSTSASYGRIAVATCFAACIGDFAVTFVIGFLHGHYDFINQSESYLGTDDSPVAVYMNIWGVLFTILFVVCAWALRRTILSSGRWATIAVWLIAIYGIGEGMGSGLFPYNHVGAELTLSGKLHSLFSGIGVSALVALPYVLLKLFPASAFPALHRLFLIVAISAPTFILLFLLSKDNALPYKGLWQRLFILDYYLLLMVLAWQALPGKNTHSGLHHIV